MGADVFFAKFYMVADAFSFAGGSGICGNRWRLGMGLACVVPFLCDVFDSILS